MSIQDRIAGAALGVVGGLPTAAQRLLGGTPKAIDGQTLDPEIQLALRLLNAVESSSFENLPLPQARAQIDAESRLFGGTPIPVETVRDISIPADGRTIPARLYRPAGESDSASLLVYFHGGGFVLGSLESGDSVCRFLAEHADVTVLSVDYRLAPEHPFPAGTDDAVAAFRYCVDHAPELGVDPNSIAVGGDSAGGNLATVVAQVTVDDDTPPVFQLLFFPWVDLSVKRPSHSLFATGFFLTDAQLDWYAAHYLSGGASTLDPKVSPLLTEDLGGLPPAYIAVAGFDPLRDEGEAYAHKLSAAGVPTALRRHSGLIHAFVNSTGVGHTGRDAMLEACGALRVGLATARGAESRDR
ncbi:alpha/beta hydrolase [Rhodococcus sp. 27YEA15]|uniref:alpha/beta hydrolase n=1 Tax=Rhodococcus sp. 27YEA15 TaxID=3156259 RepID=UPI003C7BAE0C